MTLKWHLNDHFGHLEDVVDWRPCSVDFLNDTLGNPWWLREFWYVLVDHFYFAILGFKAMSQAFAQFFFAPKSWVRLNVPRSLHKKIRNPNEKTRLGFNLSTLHEFHLKLRKFYKITCTMVWSSSGQGSDESSYPNERSICNLKGYTVYTNPVSFLNWPWTSQFWSMTKSQDAVKSAWINWFSWYSWQWWGGYPFSVSYFFSPWVAHQATSHTEYALPDSRSTSGDMGIIIELQESHPDPLTKDSWLPLSKMPKQATNHSFFQSDEVDIISCSYTQC